MKPKLAMIDGTAVSLSRCAPIILKMNDAFSVDVHWNEVYVAEWVEVYTDGSYADSLAKEAFGWGILMILW